MIDLDALLATSFVSQIWSHTIEEYGESPIVALAISKASEQVWDEGILDKLPDYLQSLDDKLSD